MCLNPHRERREKRIKVLIVNNELAQDKSGRELRVGRGKGVLSEGRGLTSCVDKGSIHRLIGLFFFPENLRAYFPISFACGYMYIHPRATPKSLLLPEPKMNS